MFKIWLCIFFVVVAGCRSTPTGSGPNPQPPVARKIPTVTKIHGDELVDNYSWLRQKGSRQVRRYLEAENAYTAWFMKPTEPFQETLYREILGRIQETDSSVPYRDGNFFYYRRTQEGKQYPIYCRKSGSLDAPEHIILDLNLMAVGKEFMAVGAYEFSDDGNLLAYTTDETGLREYTLCVKDLRTGKLGPEKIPRVAGVAWAADNRTLVYATEDEAKRPYRFWRHTRGAAKDELVYEEKDEMFSLDVGRSRSRAIIFINSASATTDEVRFLPADHPARNPQVIAAREPDHQYSVDHGDGLFYIRTNDKGRNFRIVTAPVAAPQRANWKELVPHRADVMIDDLNVFADHLVLSEREDGLPQITVRELAGGARHRIAFPEAAYAVGLADNAEFHARVLRFTYESLTTPVSVFDYDMVSRGRKLLKMQPIKGGYDPALYQTERVVATTTDGTAVPISLVYRKALRRPGGNPLLLYGYGAYGIADDVWFSPDRLSLLDRGFIFAVAHIRGGGEFGKRWHDAGRMMHKRNTFTDFTACAEQLIAQGYTTRHQLAINGASAGGLTIGAVLNMRPDLFHAALVEVPFVDVINTMLDESLPLTVGEFEEWGNPKLKDQYQCMKSYSPYDNIRATNYPAMLVRTSLNDSQVMYWEPAKYVAKLRATKTDSNPLLFKINLAGGHGGKSGRYDALRDTAFDYAFLLTQLGITR